MKYKVNYGLWVIMKYQCRFVISERKKKRRKERERERWRERKEKRKEKKAKKRVPFW